ncbi:uncharacterized protein LOC127086708 [Lathyrus oleraceus]|uniref:uncharacterized protein LOC127086708 n=1 Tax=Pisum sativum TaxID=3888 RepID=UPI0021D12F57|nr:uncharacterized protein LOC127086708 [Pisum sativum]
MKPFIPNEEVDKDNGDDQEEVRFEDLFGTSDDYGNRDLIDTPTLAEEMKFENKEPYVVALQHWHIKRSLDYSVTKSDNARYIIKCKNSECEFKCRVSLRKSNSKWNIDKLSGPHTCTTTSMSQDHRKLNSEMISQSIMELVNRDASLKVKWILVTKTYLPSNSIKLQTLSVISYDGSQLGDKRIFCRLFWAFRPCIRGFAYCKPLVQVDETWLYCKYKGTMLMVVAQDGNTNIFPIAFALVEDKPELIKSAYNNPENGWQYPLFSHVYCIRHIAQNFMREIKDKELRKKVVNMGYALIEATFNYYHEEIRRTNNETLSWIDNIPRKKWAMTYDEGQR